ncbi:MAG: YciK family oxidoreductase [Gammaproteobacteria bacterium]|nr:MAG: YciK family oxidoreductase [Gammaproteobacteria bacterium]
MKRKYKPAPDLLADRHILVTGAGDGIGKAAAHAYAAHGATVILLGRTQRKLEAVYDSIVDAGHPQPAIYPMDLTGAAPPNYEDLAETLATEFGHLDGLLHNAAALGTPAPVEHYQPEEWVRVMQVNVNAPFMLTKVCLPLLNRAKDASIIFTSSEVGRRGKAYWGAYATSNFAIEGLMQVLADELESAGKIRVNSIDPGPVRTAMRTASYPGEDPRTLPSPKSIMRPYLFLMGPDSREINGQALNAQ